MTTTPACESITEWDVWDACVTASPQPHPLQSYGWGELKSRFGWRAERICVPGAGAAQVLYRRVAGLTLAYVPRGPLVDWNNHSAACGVVDALCRQCRREGASVLKIEPELAETPAHRAQLIELGFRPSAQGIQPSSTIVVDLAGGVEAALRRMKPKWRYNIRLAERKEVIVRPARRDDLPVVYAMMEETARRDGFAAHSAGYYAAAYDLFVPRQAAFLLAEYAGEPLAAIVVFAHGAAATYLWGASRSSERSRMPNYALQRAGMEWAVSRGAIRYDLWGIPDSIGLLALGLNGGDGSGHPAEGLPLDLEHLPEGGLWGVYRFKQGFGGDVVRLVGSWDRDLDRVGSGFYRAGLAVRAGGQQLAERRSRAGRVITGLHAVAGAAEWRTALAGLPEPHVLQSWEWGEIKAQSGWQAERFIVAGAGGQPAAAFQFLWRQAAGHLPLRVAYVPKGPVVDWQDSELAEAVLRKIETHAAARGCIFVKIDPDLIEESAAGRSLRHTFFRRGWRFSQEQVQFKNTAWSDLGAGEEALLAGMKGKWRYNVRLAERRGVRVRLGAADDLPLFYDLYAETGRRDGFLIRPYTYYRSTWGAFLAAEAEEGNPAGGALLLAEHPEEATPMAGVFLLRYGTRAWYFYGASSERRRRDMPNALLQWEAMRWSLAQGCTVYDWWGAPTDPDDADDRLQGVWQFKAGFGAELRRHVGAWDFPIGETQYRLYTEAAPRLLALMRRARRGEPGSR